MADEPSKSVSFTFAKKTSAKKLQNTGSSVLGTDHGLRDEEEEKDFIKSAEGNDLKRYSYMSCERFYAGICQKSFHSWSSFSLCNLVTQLILDYTLFFFSVKPKEVAKELVIPLQKKNRWILPTTVDGLDKQAAEELVKGKIKMKVAPF